MVTPTHGTLLVLAALFVARALPAAAADELPWSRPAGCDPATCGSCPDYRVSTDNFTDGAVPQNVCGDDGVYFPVPIEFFANCAKRYPYSWRCISCCSAGCAQGACKAQGVGEFNTTHGCSACAAGTSAVALQLQADTCRSCYRSQRCFTDDPSAYQVCEAKAPGQSVAVPPQDASAQPPPVSAQGAAPTRSPPPPPPPPQQQQQQASPPAVAPSPVAEAPAPAAQAAAPAAENATATPAPQPAASAPQDIAAPAPAPSNDSAAAVQATATAAPPPPASAAAGVAVALLPFVLSFMTVMAQAM